MLRRSFRAALWLGPAAAPLGCPRFRGAYASVGAAAVTNVLFVLALPLTYIAGVGAIVHASARPREAVVRASALTLGLVAALALLEAAAAARLVHWELVLGVLRGEQQHYVTDPDLGSDTHPTCGDPGGRGATSKWGGDSRRPGLIG